MSYYFSREHDLAVAKIPKSGVTTMRAWLPNRIFKTVENDEALGVSRRVVFIRHPLDRLASCYSFFCYKRALGTPYTNHSMPIDVVNEITMGWKPFVDYVLISEPDDHWRRQCEYFGDVGNIFHRFDDLPRLYRNYWGDDLPTLNVSPRIPVEEYRTRELLSYYAEDMRIYNGIR